MSELELDSIKDLVAEEKTKFGTYRYTLADGTKIQLPTPMLSVTQVYMYMKCPRQYEERYVKGVKTPPGVALIEGSSNHDALEYQNGYQIAHGEPAKIKKVLAHFGDALQTRAATVPSREWRSSGESVDTVHARGVVMLTNYMATMASKFTPVACEEGFTMSVKGVPFQGFIDLAEADALWDYKVVGKSSASRYKRGIDHDLQLTAYSYAKRVRRVGLIPLLKETGVIEKWASVRTKPNYLGFEDTITRVAKAISLGAFPTCLPDSWWCNNRFCGYWKDCRGKFE